MVKAYRSEKGERYPNYERGIYNELAQLNDNIDEMITLLRNNIGNSDKGEKDGE